MTDERYTEDEIRAAWRKTMGRGGTLGELMAELTRPEIAPHVVVTYLYEDSEKPLVGFHGDLEETIQIYPNHKRTNIMPHYPEDKVMEWVDGPFQCSHNIGEFCIRLRAKMDAHKRGEG